MSRFKEKFAIEKTRYRVDMALNSFGGAGNTIDAYLAELQAFTEAIDARAIYDEALAEAERAIASADYGWVLRNFNHKSLVNQVGRFYDLKPSTFAEKVKTLAATNAFGVLDIMRAHLPPF